MVAVAAASLMIVTGVLLRDVEAVVIGVGLGASAALLGLRSGIAGRILLVLLFADIIVWMAPAAWSNANHSASATGLLLPLALVALSAAGIASALRVPDRVVAFTAAGLVGAALVVALMPGGGSDVPAVPGALQVSSRGAKFSEARLEVSAGDVAVRFRNHDLFWHTFTIDALDVDIRTPVARDASRPFPGRARHLRVLLRHPRPRGHRDEGHAHRPLTSRQNNLSSSRSPFSAS